MGKALAPLSMPRISRLRTGVFPRNPQIAGIRCAIQEWQRCAGSCPSSRTGTAETVNELKSVLALYLRWRNSLCMRERRENYCGDDSLGIYFVLVKLCELVDVEPPDRWVRKMQPLDEPKASHTNTRLEITIAFSDDLARPEPRSMPQNTDQAAAPNSQAASI